MPAQIRQVPITACQQTPDSSAENTANVRKAVIPKELSEIPEAYFSPAENPGTLVDLNYDTYESFSYEQKSQPLEKHAVIYLPSGYDENRQYDIFYLMHGGWGNENMTLGTPEEPSGFKNVIDHMIDAGRFVPSSLSAQPTTTQAHRTAQVSASHCSSIKTITTN